jgi:hypothetical protein
VDFQFDYDKDEVRATFSCSDDYADIRLCHNADDLEEYIIRRYGAFLVKEGIPNPKNYAMDMKKIAEVLTNPKLNKRDNYQDEYPKILTSEEWTKLKQDCPEMEFENRIQNASYKKDEYQIRLGIWHG